MLFGFDNKRIKQHARALEKFLKEKGIAIPHGQARDALARLAGFENWNGYAANITPDAINAMLDSFEMTHVQGSVGLNYDYEAVIQTHTGFSLCTPAYPEPASYVRVIDPLGREIAYWNSDEIREDPEEVIGAIIGAVVRGKGVEKPEAPNEAEPTIFDVPLHSCSAVGIDGDYFPVSFVEEEVITWLSDWNNPDNPYNSDEDTDVMSLQKEDSGLIWDKVMRVKELLRLKWSKERKAFVGHNENGELSVYSFFFSYEWKPQHQATKASAENKVAEKVYGDPMKPEFGVLVTMDTTASRLFTVHADSHEEANSIALNAAVAEQGSGFEVDEGNHKRHSDFYVC